MPSRRFYVVSIITSVVGLGIGGALGASAWRAQQSDTPTSQETTIQELETPVRIFVVGTKSSPAVQQSLTGVVRARHEIDMAFRVGGKILSRHVEIGQRVEEEQLLFQLEAADYELELKSARANLQVADAEVLQAVSDEKRRIHGDTRNRRGLSSIRIHKII
ncbi:MAG: biotin/lipoyl-binding protein [Pirellulaceae bacterium]|nr:biotin/lipoyl-binding protein [Pirellulaceae bacterium]